MEKISVIVPVYNVEKVLERCLNSLVEQSYSNLEIILIDDGSTDGSLNICDSYAENYSNIKVYSQKNKGQSAARNLGLKMSTGEYIGFVDSDDWVHKNMYEVMYQHIKEYDADIADVNGMFVRDKQDVLEASEQTENNVEVIEKNDLLRDYMFNGLNKSVGQFAVWRKLFKRELFNNVSFLEGYIYEDKLINFELLKNATKLVRINKVYYYYYQDVDSTIRKGFTKKDLDLLVITNKLVNSAYQEGDANLAKLAKVKEVRSYFSLLAKIAYFGSELSPSEQNKIEKELVSSLRRNIKDLVKGPIPITRKVLAIMFIINFDVSKFIFKMLTKMKIKY